MPRYLRRLLAICIGIDLYADPNISNLKFACADARSLHDCLVRTFPTTDAAVVLMLNEDATTRAVRTAIGERLARIAKPDDIVLIFFAGHGSPETSMEIDGTSRYLVLHDTQFQNIFATGLDMERDFIHLLERIRSRHIIVFLDACFSGRAGGRTFEGPRLERLRREIRGPHIDLRKLELGEGRLIISACDDWQVAREDPQIGHGVFTFCLLQVMTKKSSCESTISVARLYDEVATRVARMTNGCQHPIFNGRGKLPMLPFLSAACTEVQ